MHGHSAGGNFPRPIGKLAGLQRGSAAVVASFYDERRSYSVRFMADFLPRCLFPSRPWPEKAENFGGDTDQDVLRDPLIMGAKGWATAVAGDPAPQRARPHRRPLPAKAANARQLAADTVPSLRRRGTFQAAKGFRLDPGRVAHARRSDREPSIVFPTSRARTARRRSPKPGNACSPVSRAPCHTAAPPPQEGGTKPTNHL